MNSKYRFDDVIEEVREYNSDLKYGLSDIVGVTIEKGLIPTVANLAQTALDRFYIVAPRTFIYNPRTHGVRLGIGFNQSDQTYITSWNNVAFRVKKNVQHLIMPEFLWLYFMRNEWDRETNYHAWGSSTIVFSWDTFRSLTFNAPPYDEQVKIVQHYKTISDRIALKRKINDNLTAMAKTFFKKILKDEEFPPKWSIAQVGDFCEANIANLTQDENFHSILYLDTGNISENFVGEVQELNLLFDEIPSRAKRKVFDGDIVYSTVRPNLKHYGIIYKPSINFVASTGFAVLHNKGKGVSNEFLYMWLIEDTTVEYLQSVAENSVSTYPSLNVSDLTNLRIVIPDSDTLGKANRVLQRIFNLIFENNAQIKSLSELNAVMMTTISSR